MNFKKHMGFMIAGSIVVLLMIASGVMVFMGASQYSAENAQYQAALATFNELCNKDPFPSETNVTLELKNVLELTNLVARLSTDLRKGQISARQMAPEAFISHIQNMARNLSKHMVDSGVQLPTPNYDFDFDKYVSKGIPPNPLHISGLTYQFQLIEVFCGILADAKITELKIVKRARFDEGGAAAPMSESDSIDVVPAGKLFSKVQFSISFIGREDSIWKVLNQMAMNQPFIVVTRVNLTNPKLTITLPSSQDGAPATADATGDASAQAAGIEGAVPQVVPRAKRVLIGNEQIEADLELDVYRFANPEDIPSVPVKKK